MFWSLPVVGRTAISTTVIDHKKSLIIQWFENLNFFRGIEKVRGTAENLGIVKRDGRDAHRVIFRYGGGLFYERLIDVKNGELLLTVNDQGLEIQEVGEIRVDGIRFPQKVMTLVNGEIINTVSFETITVNEQFEDDVFELPGGVLNCLMMFLKRLTRSDV